MDTKDWPLELSLEDWLPAMAIADWLDFNYPSRMLSPPGDAAILISKQLGMEEGLLHKLVHEYFYDPETFQLSEHWLIARDCL